MKVELIKSLSIPEFSSASAVNYCNGKLYLIGDDSTHIMIMDADYKKINTIDLFEHTEKRIPKSEKADLETSILIRDSCEFHLLAFGSASKKNRKKVIRITSGKAGGKEEVSMFENRIFIRRLKRSGIDEINIEGAAMAGRDLILSNRGNRSHPENFIIKTSLRLLEDPEKAEINLVKLLIPEGLISKPVGISELCFLEPENMLLITLTSEDTGNAYDDGAIGDSFLGWIRNAPTKLNSSEIILDGVINLSGVHQDFAGQKIEGICVEAILGNDVVLHLVSDNDNGESHIFKIRLTI